MMNINFNPRSAQNNFTHRLGLRKLLKIASYCRPDALEALCKIDKMASKIKEFKKWEKIVQSEPARQIVPLDRPLNMSVQYVSESLLLLSLNKEPTVVLKRLECSGPDRTVTFENVLWLGKTSKRAYIWSVNEELITVNLKEGMLFARQKLTYDADLNAVVSKQFSQGIKADFKPSTQFCLQEDGYLYGFTQKGRVNLFQIANDRFKLMKTVQLSKSPDNFSLFGVTTLQGPFTVLVGSSIVHCNRSIQVTEIDQKAMQETNVLPKNSFSKVTLKDKSCYLEIFAIFETTIARYFSVKVDTAHPREKTTIENEFLEYNLSEDDTFVAIDFRRGYVVSQFPNCFVIYHKQQRKEIYRCFDFPMHRMEVVDGRLFFENKDGINCWDLFSSNRMGSFIQRDTAFKRRIVDASVTSKYQFRILSQCQEYDRDLKLVTYLNVQDFGFKHKPPTKSPKTDKKESKKS